MENPDPSKRVIQCVIPPEAEGVRLDSFLQKRFTYRSRSAWQTSIKNGEIRLNGLPVRASRLLHRDERLTFEFPDVPEPGVDRTFQVILETDDFLAVNKPGQIPVHPSGRFFRNTLLMVLQEKFGKLYPVNRLDRETSGVTVFAKTPDAASRLSTLFADRQTHKRYLVIVYGVFPELLTGEGWLSADPESTVRKKRRFTSSPENCPEPEACKTTFRRLASNDVLSVVEAIPSTGRLHQIRATLCSLGFPLVGDKLYGPDDSLYLRYIDNALTESDRARLILDRQALHAVELSFRSPFTGEALVLSAPPPLDFQGLQDRIIGV